MKSTAISIADTIESGRFGPLAIGVSRQDVGEMFGSPSDATTTNRKRTSCVWRYGSIEFHFDDELLSLIHCDADDLFDGGPYLIINQWKLRKRMPLDELKSILDAMNLHYTGCENRGAPDCVLRLDTGCSFGFVLDSNAGLGPTGLNSWSIQKYR